MVRCMGHNVSFVETHSMFWLDIKSACKQGAIHLYVSKSIENISLKTHVVMVRIEVCVYHSQQLLHCNTTSDVNMHHVITYV